MQLVEQHVIEQNHLFFAEIDAAAFAFKNLFNAIEAICWLVLGKQK